MEILKKRLDDLKRFAVLSEQGNAWVKEDLETGKWYLIYNFNADRIELSNMLVQYLKEKRVI